MNLLSSPIIRDWTYRSGSSDISTSWRRATTVRHSWNLLLLVKCIVLLSLSFVAQAADQDINKNWRSIAIKGYDPVAYFTMGKAVVGKKQFEHRWHDARWRFVSEEHLKLFADNPEQYAPRFGGYCAEGMSRGRKASIDPQAWLIVEGDLYLNYSVEAREEMALHPEQTIEKADLIWEKLRSRLKEP